LGKVVEPGTFQLFSYPHFQGHRIWVRLFLHAVITSTSITRSALSGTLANDKATLN
jgi:hypothetical protein